MDGTNLPRHGGTGRRTNHRTGRLSGRLAPGYALREPATQPNKNKQQLPKERQSTELSGLDFLGRYGC
jgi:hypothetical protein